MQIFMIILTHTQQAFKSVLALMDKSAQNKAGIRPTPQADTPHNSVNNYVFLYKKFEKFWVIYPAPQKKNSALSGFSKKNIGEILFAKILAALSKQINHYQQQKLNGALMPNWLSVRYWENCKSRPSYIPGCDTALNH
jgi:hypothetical protein